MPRLLTAGGGGLARVAALSDSWGTCATAEGKVVWFTRSVSSPQDILRVPRVPLGGIGTAEAQPMLLPGPVPAVEPVAVREALPALV
jgi:hypothetical protein